MNFTFGIITPKIDNNENLNRVIDSIVCNMPFDKYEILVVSESIRYHSRLIDKTVRFIPFDCEDQSGWITKPKNLITEEAFYDNIVYMHDYVTLEEGWYEGFEESGDDWDVCMNVVNNLDGSRYRDWCIWGVEEGHHPRKHTINEPWSDGMEFYGQASMAPYDLESKSPYQFYASGAYWLAKKDVMMKYPLDETLIWGEGEDVEWSLRTFPHVSYKMNTKSSVKLLKQKGRSLVDYDQVYNI